MDVDERCELWTAVKKQLNLSDAFALAYVATDGSIHWGASYTDMTAKQKRELARWLRTMAKDLEASAKRP